jgi:hypothetical protein
MSVFPLSVDTVPAVEVVPRTTPVSSGYVSKHLVLVDGVDSVVEPKSHAS